MDTRMHTFLTLCEQRSYTKTAKKLFITQPAVTQHIQYLEKQYHAKLFQYNGKQLLLTKQGELLYRYAMTQAADESRIRLLMQQKEESSGFIRFGATLSIGEYLMPDILSRYLSEHPGCRISMLTENTHALLHRLEQGEIDFAIVEGRFDKRLYGNAAIRSEQFLAVCSNSFGIPSDPLSLDALTGYPLIVRESGSGTRDILENLLHSYNLSVESFPQVLEIGNFNTILRLVASGYGITFAYRPVVQAQLACGALRMISLKGVSIEREFNFVYLKGSVFESEYREFYEFCKHCCA